MTVVQPFYLRAGEAPQLPSGWVYLSTEEASVQLKPGKLFDKKTTSETGRVPVLSQGLSDYIGFHHEAPGVQATMAEPVVTFANHTCALRLMTVSFSCIQNIFPKVGRPGVTDTRYFYYASQGRVNLTDYKGHHPLFRQALIPIPPIDTQRRIASILGTYDDLIEVNRRRVAVLEKMARGLFEEWFVRFRFPGHESVPLVDTPGGPLPEGWAWEALEDFLVLQRGFDLPKSKRTEGSVPVFSASGFHGGHSEHRVAGPGIVTGRSGTIGQVHLVMDDFWPLNTTLYIREFKRAGPAYALLLLRHLDLAKHSGGAAVPTLNRNHIHGIKLPAAPQPLIDQFESFSFANFQLIRTIEQQNQRLAASRDLLLPRLISGQLCVQAAGRELEEAA